MSETNIQLFEVAQAANRVGQVQQSVVIDTEDLQLAKVSNLIR